MLPRHARALSDLHLRFRFILALCLLLAVASTASKGQAAPQDAHATLKLTCSSPVSALYPGDPVTITALVDGFTPQDAKDLLLFQWTGSPQLESSDPAITFTPTAPGQTTIHGKVALKSDPTRFGECDQTITVSAFQPPTIGCSASPSTVLAGSSATIIASGSSPTGRPLTYAFGASAGTIHGSGSTATLATGGATGVIAINCLVTDDKGQTASANTAVNVVRMEFSGAPTAIRRGSPPPPSPPPPPVMMAPPPPSASALPPFPWPPPMASSRIEIPMNLGSAGLKTNGQVDTRILAALTQKGYVQRAHYAVPNGFVLITRLEQINSQGIALNEPYRFSGSLPPPASLSSYLTGLFTSPPGYFRIIAFVITNADFNDVGNPLDEAAALDLLNGPAALPGPFATRALPSGAKLTALIYEYQKASTSQSSRAIPIHATVPAVTHLQRAGLWQLLVTP